jgi:photosystem II stability/assembly factor-like uncharacterized protein
VDLAQRHQPVDNGFNDFVAYDVVFADADHGWISGNSGSFDFDVCCNFRTTDGGATWQMQTYGVFDDVMDVFPIDENEVWAATYNGTVFRTTNGGVGWDLVPTGYEDDPLLGFDGIAARPDGTVWVAGAYGTILKRTAGGAVPGDIDGDGTVGILDFLALLPAWGPCAEPCPPACAADLDGDCTVGVLDFLLLLANWS